MTTNSKNAKHLVSLYTFSKSFDEVLSDIKQKKPEAMPEAPKFPESNIWSNEAKQSRIELLKKHRPGSLAHLSGDEHNYNAEYYRGNIENFIGLTKIPTGLIGPLFISGTEASGDFYVPLATTEAALVASYNRGARATRLSGGITSVCTTEGLQRTPVWKFDTLVEVGQFIYWLLTQIEKFKEIASAKSRYAVLQDVKLNMEGNNVLSVFEYTCGDAAGQNMVTICTEAVCKYIVQHSPVKPNHWFIESNYSGDKKATAVSFSTVRGKKVTAEAVVGRKVVADILKSTPEDIAMYWQTSMVAAAQSGSIGLQGHIANGLTALFMACGQDVACVAEAYVGITRMEVDRNEDLYVSITLPSLVVGTVGGGTSLPTQNECLELLGCKGKNSARKFAEICAAVALAGELSIAAAIASGRFGKAHEVFRRKI